MNGFDFVAVMGSVILAGSNAGSEDLSARKGEKVVVRETLGRRGSEYSAIEQRIDEFRRLGESSDFLLDIKSAYSRHAQSIELMAQSLAAGDGVALRRAAHSLIGSSGILGASRLVTVLREIENRARVGDLEGLADRLFEVNEEYRRVMAILSVAANHARENERSSIVETEGHKSRSS